MALAARTRAIARALLLSLGASSAWLSPVTATPRTAVAPEVASAARRFADIPTEVWTVRYRNSTGDHAGAATLADALLTGPGGATLVSHRADLWLHLAFARTRLGETDAAAAAFVGFVAEARGLAPSDPLRLEMTLLREALGLPALKGLAPAHTTFAPPTEDSYWRVGAPEDLGVRAEDLRALVADARATGADGLLVTRRGAIVLEWYSPLYREPMRTMSSAKSITGLLAGLLVDRGKLSLDDRVSATLPAWSEDPRGAVTVRHLLSMTSGLPRRPGRSAAAGEGWTAFAASLTPLREPGAAFEYTNEGVQLLSPILERAAGRPLWEFARDELFVPLGALKTEMRRDGQGATNTFADAATTLREFARFGELVRRRGAWPERGQLVSEAWIEAMTTPSATSASHGLLWWLGSEPRTQSMQGYLDTDVWVLPDVDVVAARVQSRAYLHALEAFDEGAFLTRLAAACE